MYSNTTNHLDTFDKMSEFTTPTYNSDLKTQDNCTEDLAPLVRKMKTKKGSKINVSSKSYKKTAKEIAFLEEQFLKDPTWSRKTVQYCKKTLNLRTDQVYKWGFDKKVALDKSKKGRANPLSNRELGLQTRKEIFMHDDLNQYVTEVISGFEAELDLVSLNDISANLNHSKVSNFA